MLRIWRCSVKNDSPFLDIAPERETVSITVDGEAFEVPEGANLAAALLAAGLQGFRNTPVSGAPRGPFCMMGACYDCLVEIDGVTQQACMTKVADGLVVNRAHGSEAIDDG